MKAGGTAQFEIRPRPKGAAGSLFLLFSYRALLRHDRLEFGIVDERLHGPVAFEPLGLAFPTAINKLAEIGKRPSAVAGKHPGSGCVEAIPVDVIACPLQMQPPFPAGGEIEIADVLCR